MGIGNGEGEICGAACSRPCVLRLLGEVGTGRARAEVCAGGTRDGAAHTQTHTHTEFADLRRRGLTLCTAEEGRGGDAGTRPLRDHQPPRPSPAQLGVPRAACIPASLLRKVNDPAGPVGLLPEYLSWCWAPVKNPGFKLKHPHRRPQGVSARRRTATRPARWANRRPRADAAHD